MANTNRRLISFQVDQLRVVIHASRPALGKSAAWAVAEQMRRRLRKQDRIAMIFASAPSQEEFLAALAVQEDLDWQRITTFQMDEYIGLTGDAPQNFGRFLRERSFSRVRPGSVHYLSSEENPADDDRTAQISNGQIADADIVRIDPRARIVGRRL